jgi:hypothetical protein
MLERKVICENCGEDYPPRWPHECTVSARPAGSPAELAAKEIYEKLDGLEMEAGQASMNAFIQLAALLSRVQPLNSNGSTGIYCYA